MFLIAAVSLVCLASHTTQAVAAFEAHHTSGEYVHHNRNHHHGNNRNHHQSLQQHHSEANSLKAGRIPCQEARLKCAFREGCGTALQNYILRCSEVLQSNRPLDYCPEICQHSLIALTSTEEGKELMSCDCEDDFCHEAKQRVEVCRPEVSRIVDGPDEAVVSCRVAQLICAADTYCAAALRYYHINCKAMFHGRKCTHRCRNSINILRRREKAAKLETCVCDGQEDYDCVAIQRNMDRLCFHRRPYSDEDLNILVPPARTPATLGPAHSGDGVGNSSSTNKESNDIVPVMSMMWTNDAAAPSWQRVNLTLLFAMLLTVAGVIR